MRTWIGMVFDWAWVGIGGDGFVSRATPGDVGSVDDVVIGNSYFLTDIGLQQGFRERIVTHGFACRLPWFLDPGALRALRVGGGLDFRTLGGGWVVGDKGGITVG